MLQRLYKRFPSAQSLKDNRFLKPFRRYLDHHFLWQVNRRAVAGGVAIGLFFGILLPFLQIFFAALAAILARVNLPVAAFSTLVSNPLTFPPLYYLAYRIGDVLTGPSSTSPERVIEADIEQAMSLPQGEVAGWLPRLLDWIQSIGLPLALGLLVLATVSAVSSYFLINAAWKLRVRWRWRQRQQRRARLKESMR